MSYLNGNQTGMEGREVVRLSSFFAWKDVLWHEVERAFEDDPGEEEAFKEIYEEWTALPLREWDEWLGMRHGSGPFCFQTLFLILGPMEWFCMRLAPDDAMSTSSWLMLHRFLDLGSDPERMLLALGAKLPSLVRGAPLDVTCSLLQRLCLSDPRCKDVLMMEGSELFVHLANRVRANYNDVPLIVEWLIECDIVQHAGEPTHSVPVVVQLCSTLLTSMRDHAVRLLVECVGKRTTASALWKELLCSHIRNAMRVNTPPCMVPLLRHMLDDTNVRFVVELHRHQLFSHVAWLAEHREEWASLRPLLFRTTPSADVGKDVVCPLTMDTPVHPVVASDGHTYERDELLKFFVRTHPDTLSPVTQQPLTYHLHRNFCLSS